MSNLKSQISQIKKFIISNAENGENASWMAEEDLDLIRMTIPQD